MDPRARVFLDGVLGADGAAAIARSADADRALGSVLTLRTALAWCSILARAQLQSRIPGTDADIQLRKSDAGYDGQVGGRSFKGEPLVRVAAMVSDAVGDKSYGPVPARPDTLRKLGRVIDLLVQEQYLPVLKKAAADAHQPSAPRTDAGFELRVQRHPGSTTITAHSAGRQVGCAVLDHGEGHLKPVALELLVRHPHLQNRMHALAERVTGLPVLAKAEEPNNDWADQEYGDEDGAYRVGDLAAHAARYPVQNIPVAQLHHIVTTTDSDEPYGSPEFHARAMASDTRYPVLLVQYPPGGAHGPTGLENADGLHRIYKHIQQGATHVPARVIPSSALPALRKPDEPEDLDKVQLNPAESAQGMTPGPLSPHAPVERIESRQLSSGLYHHAAFSPMMHGIQAQPVHHSISTSPDPRAQTGVLATLHGSVHPHDADFMGGIGRAPWKDGNVMHVGTTAVAPGHRGGGIGTLLYHSALQTHGRMVSDSHVSAGATGVWSKLHKMPNVRGALGVQGDEADVHWAEHTGPKPPAGLAKADLAKMAERFSDDSAAQLDVEQPQAGREIHRATTQAGPGLWHHVYESGGSPGNFMHVLSRQQQPFGPAVASITGFAHPHHPETGAPGTWFQASVAATAPEERGAGVGTALMRAVLAHHGQMVSDNLVSAAHDRTWRKLLGTPGVEGAMAPTVPGGTIAAFDGEPGQDREQYENAWKLHWARAKADPVAKAGDAKSQPAPAQAPGKPMAPQMPSRAPQSPVLSGAKPAAAAKPKGQPSTKAPGAAGSL